jgi:hypothetical protein
MNLINNTEQKRSEREGKEKREKKRTDGKRVND